MMKTRSDIVSLLEKMNEAQLSQVFSFSKFIISEQQANSNGPSIADNQPVTSKTGEDEPLDSVARFVNELPDDVMGFELETILNNNGARNAMANANIKTIGELKKFSDQELLETPSFGKKKYQALLEDLMNFYDGYQKEGFPVDSDDDNDSEIACHELNEIPLGESFPGFFERLIQTRIKQDRSRDVVRRRTGLYGRSETLEEIASSYGISRARIGQIEQKSLESIGKSHDWETVFLPKISDALLGNDIVELGKLHEYEGWFSGVDDSFCRIFETIVARFVDGFGVIESDDVIYVVRGIDQDVWNEWDKQARHALENIEDGPVPVEFVVNNVLAGIAGSLGLAEVMWLKLQKRSLTGSVDGVDAFFGYGKTVKAITRAIMNNSDRPLHYSEVYEIAHTRYDSDHSEQSFHNELNEEFDLVARGTFGASRHFDLSDSDIDFIASLARNLIVENPEKLHWHSHELAAGINSLANRKKVNPYIVNYVLKRADSGLKNLKKGVWAVSGSEGAENGRTFIHDLALKFIKDRGFPMAGAELKVRIARERGIASTFQLHEKDDLVQVDRALWGLKSRDGEIWQKRLESALDALEAVLQQRESGLYETEISAAMAGRWPDGHEFHRLFIQDAALEDPRFRVDDGGYLYLNQWGGSRRVSPLVHLREKAQNSPNNSLDFEDAKRTLRQELGLDFVNSDVHRALYNSGFFYDHDRKAWICGNGEPIDD